ncbi:hypothetical protein LJR220_006625 [Bradyrhizobium sp. LjRoot220]|uniref:hypothetical protein n=1 Tax=Bradyrhizobium sp. LjRoot220 TaxID=3342284 RepID=UPI003ECE11F2
MRKLIVAATALAFVSTAALAPAVAQDKMGGTTGTAAQSGDATGKGDKMAPKKTTKKVSKAKTDAAK